MRQIPWLLNCYENRHSKKIKCAMQSGRLPGGFTVLARYKRESNIAEQRAQEDPLVRVDGKGGTGWNRNYKLMK